ncbi:MAG: hypothetical protein Phog2KO_33100 [Phototrophicaceae bacterium]
MYPTINNSNDKCVSFQVNGYELDMLEIALLSEDILGVINVKYLETLSHFKGHRINDLHTFLMR